MSHPNQQQTYDRQAEDFAAKAPGLMTWEFISKPALDRVLNVDAHTVILDQGSASGRVEEYLLGRGVKPANITGIELSSNQVEIAKTRFPDVRFRQGDIRTLLPIQEVGTFDLVVSHMVYEFLDDEGLGQALASAAAGLRKGGELVYIVTHPNKMILKEGLEDRGWFETSAPWGGKVDNWFRFVGDFVNATTEAGFEIDVMESLSIPDEAREADPDQWEKYHNYGHMRLLIKATKL